MAAYNGGMNILLVTGPIASGKSHFVQRASEALRGRGRQVNIIELDAYGKEALRDEDVRDQLVSAFGADILSPDGDEPVIDTVALAHAAFESPKTVEALNSATHPLIGLLATRDIASFLRKSQKGVAIVETPFPRDYLARHGFADLVHNAMSVAITAPFELRMQRCEGRIKDAEKRDALQRTYGAYTGDTVIENSGDLAAFDQAIDDLFLKEEAVS